MVDRITYDEKKWPKERKIKPKGLKQDTYGFSYTPNGSFYDMDDEYFNKNGFDVHGGFYTSDKEYIYGPEWISELGCYEDEKEKYLNYDPNEIEDDDEDIPMGGDGLDMNEDNLDELNAEFDQFGVEEGVFDYEVMLKEAEKYKLDLNTNINSKPTTNNGVKKVKVVKKKRVVKKK